MLYLPALVWLCLHATGGVCFFCGAVYGCLCQRQPRSCIGGLQCQAAIIALSECHIEHPLTKFVGACNVVKAALDSCLADEYLIRREMNSEAAAESNARLKERLRLEREEQSAVKSSGGG